VLIVVDVKDVLKPSDMDARHKQLLGQLETGLILIGPRESIRVIDTPDDRDCMRDEYGTV